MSRKQKSSTPVAFLKTVEIATSAGLGQHQPEKQKLPPSSSFLMDGFVSLNSDRNSLKPIKIWRDFGAFQSLILSDFLPFNDKSSLGTHALVEGFGGYLHLLMHSLNLQTS